ncbi:MAG: CfrBI family restriction endonuclease, partial [Chitinivibrionales bacterium]
READAEIQTRRGRIRIEVGLIAPGNQEVIEDKIARVGRNGIVIFDKLGPKSRVHQTAITNGVKLVQIRNSNPLLDVYNHVKPLMAIKLNEPFKTETDLQNSIDALKADIFTVE